VFGQLFHESPQRNLCRRFEEHIKVETPPQRIVEVSREICCSDDYAHRSRMFQFLEQGDHDSIQLAHIQRIASFLPKRVELI